MAARLGAASALQQEVLADGLVSRGEADRVAADVVVCAEEQGMQVIPTWDPQTDTMGFRYPSDSRDADALFDACWAGRFQLVDESLAIQAALSPSDSAALERAMVSCLNEEGFDVEEWPEDVENLPEPLQAESDCYQTAIRTVRP